MEWWIKINLNALKTWVQPPESIINKIESSEIINIDWIKSINNVITWEEDILIIDESNIKKNNEKIEKKEMTEEEEKIIIIEEEKIEKIKENTEISPVKISLSNIKEIKPWEEAKIIIDDTIIKEDTEKKEEEELFPAYQSDFNERQKSIFKKFEKIKNLPKTRTWLLSIFILFSILFIGYLFIFDSTHHNIEIYKTKILYILWKTQNIDNTKVKIEEKNNTNIEVNKNNETVKTEKKDTELELLWNKYKIKMVDWVEKYEFNDNIYDNIEDLKKAIQRERLSNFLKK